MKFKKYLGALGAAMVIMDGGDANAARINIAGTFGSDSSCYSEGPPLPPDSLCLVQQVERGSFNSIFDVDEKGQLIFSEIAPGTIRLNLFDQDGTLIYTDNLSGSTLNLNPRDGRFSMSIDIGVYNSSFELNFEPSLNQNFGNFLNGFYYNRAGASRKTSQSINVIAAQINRTSTIKIPESHMSGFLISAIGINIWLKRKAFIK